MQVNEDDASDAYTQAYELALTEHRAAAVKLSQGPDSSNQATNEHDDAHHAQVEPPKGWKKLKVRDDHVYLVCAPRWS